jgi:DNA-binding MarR family transcriptional regulator
VPEPIKPLTAAEERAWRAIARALIAVPRALDAALQHGQGMSLAEYFVLMNLSEADQKSLRMSEIASRGGLSPSRISRLVDELVSDGLVQRARSDQDGRVQIVVLTDKGLKRLQAAYPTHLASVRRIVVDHLAGLDLDALARAASNFAAACRPAAEDAPADPRATTDRGRGSRIS